MGHSAGKDIYRKLGRKIDNLTVKVPFNETLHSILTELYSSEEADVVVTMPYTLSPFDRIQKITKYEQNKLRKILEGLCSKGLVFDLWIQNQYLYMPSPLVVGIFEFTMMRRHNQNDIKKLAGLFHEYLQNDGAFYAANLKNNEQVSLIRTLPHEETIKASEYVEVFDYEKARSLIEKSNKFSIGLCSCRHAMLHVGKKTCDTPLN